MQVNIYFPERTVSFDLEIEGFPSFTNLSIDVQAITQSYLKLVADKHLKFKDQFVICETAIDSSNAIKHFKCSAEVVTRAGIYSSKVDDLTLLPIFTDAESSIEISLMIPRKFYELEEFILGDFDNMTLSDLFYIETSHRKIHELDKFTLRDFNNMTINDLLLIERK